jgi:hypothetical protein
MLNNVRSYMEYWDPITKSIQTAIKTPKKIIKWDTEMRAIVGDLIISMWALAWVGGTLFLGRLIKWDSGKKQSNSNISSKSINSKSISSKTIR